MPKINKEKCIGCSACIVNCPEEAIKLIDGKAIIDSKKCTNCGKCIEICPVDAITK